VKVHRRVAGRGRPEDRYDWNDGRYQASIFGRNITDEVKAVGGIDFNNLTGFINEPRTYGAEFRINF
jgi:iron complex outermembrane receptor protein